MKVVLIFNRVPPGRRLGGDFDLVVDLGIVHVLLGDGHDCRAGEGVPCQRTEVLFACTSFPDSVDVLGFPRDVSRPKRLQYAWKRLQSLLTREKAQGNGV